MVQISTLTGEWASREALFVKLLWPLVSFTCRCGRSIDTVLICLHASHFEAFATRNILSCLLLFYATIIWWIQIFINPLERRSNYRATSNNINLVHWPLICGGLWHLVQRGDWARPQPTQAHITAHPSTASIPITVLLYNGPLLCGFNVPIKG